VSTNFPSSLDNTTSQKVTDGSSIIVAALPNNMLDMIGALQAKVGANASSVQSSIDFFMRKNYVKVSDVKSVAGGGAFYAGAWRRRDLNTEDHDAGGLCSLSGNQLTLAAGTYRCQISCPGWSVEKHVARLYDVTGDTELLRGTSERSEISSDASQTRSIICGQFTVAENHSLEIQHYCTHSDGYGFGKGMSGFITDNVYTVAEFWRIPESR